MDHHTSTTRGNHIVCGDGNLVINKCEQTICIWHTFREKSSKTSTHDSAYEPHELHRALAELMCSEMAALTKNIHEQCKIELWHRNVHVRRNAASAWVQLKVAGEF